MMTAAMPAFVPNVVRDDLHAAAGLLRIIHDRVFIGDTDCGHRPFSTAERRVALRRIEDAVYQHWFTRSSPLAASEADGASVLPQIRSAHAAASREETGWVVVRALPNGAVAATRTGAEVAFAPGDFINVTRRAPQSRPGDSVTVNVRRETVDEGSGWWMTWGDAGEVPADAMLRVYWNAAAGVAPLLVSGVTALLERQRARFMMKCPTHQRLYNRADAVVLYLDESQWPMVKDGLRRVHDQVAVRLGEHVPRLTLQVGRGVSLAEDPGDGRSYGQSRAAAVAAGLLRAVDANWTDVGHISVALVAALSEQGISLRRPYLKDRAGDRDIEKW